MKTKYHINNKMEVKKCTAKDKPCPFTAGGHYDTRQEAVKSRDALKPFENFILPLSPKAKQEVDLLTSKILQKVNLSEYLDNLDEWGLYRDIVKTLQEDVEFDPSLLDLSIVGRSSIVKIKPNEKSPDLLFANKLIYLLSNIRQRAFKEQDLLEKGETTQSEFSKKMNEIYSDTRIDIHKLLMEEVSDTGLLKNLQPKEGCCASCGSELTNTRIRVNEITDKQPKNLCVNCFTTYLPYVNEHKRVKETALLSLLFDKRQTNPESSDQTLPEYSKDTLLDKFSLFDQRMKESLKDNPHLSNIKPETHRKKYLAIIRKYHKDVGELKRNMYLKYLLPDKEQNEEPHVNQTVKKLFSEYNKKHEQLLRDMIEEHFKVSMEDLAKE